MILDLIMEQKQKHTCTVCSKQFNRPDHLRTHMLVHTGERPHKCNQCGKSFTRQHHLKYHTVTHTGVKNSVNLVFNKLIRNKLVLIVLLVILQAKSRLSVIFAIRGFRGRTASRST